MNKPKKMLIIAITLLSLTGCAKNLTQDKKVVKNPETGQAIVKNILCRPENEKTIEIYNEHNVSLENLPTCKEFKVSSNGYEGLWTTIFVKPLAWFMLKIGEVTKNYGFSIILITLLIRLVLYPITKKTAMQSENMKKAKPELDKLEKKYKGKTDQASMTQKSQEMMMIYKKNSINPLSGCLFSFIQIPLFFAFNEALNRLPAIFEETMLGVQLGTSPINGISHGDYYYIIFVILVGLTTYFSFKLNSTAAIGEEQEKQMKTMMNFSIVFIVVASISMSAAIELYWIINSGFTIIQNILVKRSKKNDNII